MVPKDNQFVASKSRNPDVVGVDESILEADSRWRTAEKAAHSSALSRATQLRDILIFIVRQTILQPEEPIHEFEIAHRVLGRRSDFNPLDDNIVRVQMAHLRKKLDLYFSTEGKDEEVVITVALGTYKPIFSNRSKLSTAPLPAAELRADQRQGLGGFDDESAKVAGRERHEEKPETSVHVARSQLRARSLVAAVIILALAVGCALLCVRNRELKQSLETMHQTLSPWRYQPDLASLWSTFLDSNRDTDVVLSDDSFLLIEEISKQSTPFYGYLGRSYVAPAQTKSLSPDLRHVEDLLASKSLGNTGEFKLAQRILAMDPLDKKIHLYSARQYMPTLVKQDNDILIGGRISNPWSELFENHLNFIENTLFQGLGITTVTNRAPAAGEQQTYTSTDSVGYCVVAYLPNTGHDGKVLLLEGTSSEATEAAGDFLLSADQFTAFRNMLHTTQLPYFEVLLKTSQVRGTPLTATVEAYRVYPNLH
jgi:hypothetical protein